MDPVANTRATAQELLTLARAQGVDLAPVVSDGHFQKEQRWIFFWRKNELLSSGPVAEAEGTLHYNLQGTIAVLPKQLQDSAAAFQGQWTESGTLDSLEAAFDFLKAWLIDRKEIDDLPSRRVRRFGILRVV